MRWFAAIDPFVNTLRNDPSDSARLDALLQAAVDAIVIIDADRRVRGFSRAAEILFGYDATEVVGQNVSMLMPEPMASMHDAAVNRYLETGEARIIGVGREVKARRKDGSVFPAYLSVGQGREADGSLFFVGILHDLTTEKDAFRRVQQLASIVDSTGDAVIGHTLDGVVTYWNKGAQTLYGYSFGEAIGRPVLELVVPEDKRAEFEDVVLRTSQGQGPIRMETLRRSKSGKQLIVSLTVSPILDAQGRITGASAIARDITAKRMAEKAQAEARRAAEEANRVKADFLNIVSHELRTPLTVILGNVSLLTSHDTMPAPAEAASIAQDIEDSAHRLLGLINDLLDISDMEAGIATLRLAPVQAEELLLETAQAVERLAQAKGLSLDVRADPVELMADPQRLKQALTNLAENAIKFTDAGGVTLSAEQSGGTVLFQVEDTGPGIADEAVGRIFDAFYQSDTSSTRQAQGTGLGLTIVKRIVELHGGKINVVSEPGHGTSFVLALPLDRGASPSG